MAGVNTDFSAAEAVPGEGAFLTFTTATAGQTPTVDQIVGLRQGLLMDALAAYNEAVDGARVLEPHVDRVKLVLDFLDERPRCDACGNPV